MGRRRHVLNPDQLSMFMPAGDLANPEKTNYTGGVPDPTSGHLSNADQQKAFRIREQSLDEAMVGGPTDPTTPRKSGASLYGDIRRHGVHEPVMLHKPAPNERLDDQRPVLVKGKHRVFTAENVDPASEVPIQWT